MLSVPFFQVLAVGYPAKGAFESVKAGFDGVRWTRTTMAASVVRMWMLKYLPRYSVDSSSHMALSSSSGGSPLAPRRNDVPRGVLPLYLEGRDARARDDAGWAERLKSSPASRYYSSKTNRAVLLYYLAVYLDEGVLRHVEQDVFVNATVVVRASLGIVWRIARTSAR